MLKNSLIELRQLPKNKQKMLPEQKKKCTYLCTLYNSMQYICIHVLSTTPHTTCIYVLCIPLAPCRRI